MVMSDLRYQNVIVFGPTGEVGAATSLEAAKRGAKVFLAMRDTKKAITGIHENLEGNSFKRIQADLTDPESVAQAVKQSGAKAAFIYRAITPDAMRSTITALKESGIEHIVLLSTFSILPEMDIRDIPPREFVPYIHAQVEIVLEEVGLSHVMLRCGQFASNIFRLNLDQSKEPWEIEVPYDGKENTDGLSPVDIGRVAGAVLVNPPQQGDRIIYLVGPKLLTTVEHAEIVKRVSSRDIIIKHVSEQDWTDFLVSRGLPEQLVRYRTEGAKTRISENTFYQEPFYSSAKGNVKKYSGYEPTDFESYAKAY